MSLNNIQKDVNDWAKQFDPSYQPPLSMLARLTEENGEVARELNHLFGSKKKKAGEAEGHLGGELIDIIFTVCCIANSQNLDLQKEWEKSMSEKHYGRDKNRYIKKESQ